MGQTHLAAELAARTHAEGATVLAGRCDEDLGVPASRVHRAPRGQGDAEARRILGACDEVIRQQLCEHGGREINGRLHLTRVVW
jgi:hypothetical protein